MSQAGSLTEGSSLPGLETLTGNSGGAVPGSGSPVNIDIVGGAGVTVTGNPGTSTLTIDLTGGGIAIDSLIPDSGTSPVVPNASGEISIVGSGSITTIGGLNTLTTQLTGLTANNVLVGAGTSTITKVAPSATAGIPLVSTGAASDPSFTTAVVAGGGTGVTSNTAYAVLCGGTTSTNPIQSVASVGTSGQLLTSNGPGALPTFQTLSGTFNWVEDSNIFVGLTAGQGTILTNAGATSVFLPAATAGQVFGLASGTGNSWTITQSAGQQIFFLSQSTTVGAMGGLSSTGNYQVVILLALSANTFMVIDSMGNIGVA